LCAGEREARGQGKTATREDILKFMEGKIAKWWMPDDVTFVDSIPNTATGKILKTALRDQVKSFVFFELGRVAARSQ
jgi:fatty-acyl-CoA synthase